MCRGGVIGRMAAGLKILIARTPPVWTAYKISCHSTSIVTAGAEYGAEISLVPVL